MLNNFMTRFDVLACDHMASVLLFTGKQVIFDENMYTFCNEKVARFTKIDYVTMYSSLKDLLISYCSLDSALNHSDHIPISAALQLPVTYQLHDSLFVKSVTNSVTSNDSCKSRRLRWDHSNVKCYYEYTGVLFMSYI